jgi:hypothetical protein
MVSVFRGGFGCRLVYICVFQLMELRWLQQCSTKSEPLFSSGQCCYRLSLKVESSIGCADIPPASADHSASQTKGPAFLCPRRGSLALSGCSATNLVVIFTSFGRTEDQRERKDFLRLWRWTIALITMPSFAFFLGRAAGA